ncbi:MAG: hypothetical protein ACK52I_28805 [Pseudomonadota bacterium]
MTRSRRKHPAGGLTSAPSDKADKVRAHRRERRVVRERIHAEKEEARMPHRRELSDPWTYAKDGKRYDRGCTDRRVLGK